MADKILLGETLRGGKAELDLQELITGRTLLCSISRWGKTWTARRIVEQVFGKTGIIIVDVEASTRLFATDIPYSSSAKTSRSYLKAPSSSPTRSWNMI